VLNFDKETTVEHTQTNETIRYITSEQSVVIVIITIIEIIQSFMSTDQKFRLAIMGKKQVTNNNNIIGIYLSIDDKNSMIKNLMIIHVTKTCIFYHPTYLFIQWLLSLYTNNTK